MLCATFPGNSVHQALVRRHGRTNAIVSWQWASPTSPKFVWRSEKDPRCLWCNKRNMHYMRPTYLYSAILKNYCYHEVPPFLRSCHISGLNYPSTNFLTRITTIHNFDTCHFHTLAVHVFSVCWGSSYLCHHSIITGSLYKSTCTFTTRYKCSTQNTFNGVAILFWWQACLITIYGHD